MSDSIVEVSVQRDIPRRGEHRSIRPSDVDELKQDMIDSIAEEIAVLVNAFGLVEWYIDTEKEVPTLEAKFRLNVDSDDIMEGSGE